MKLIRHNGNDYNPQIVDWLSRTAPVLAKDKLVVITDDTLSHPDAINHVVVLRNTEYVVLLTPTPLDALTNRPPKLTGNIRVLTAYSLKKARVTPPEQTPEQNTDNRHPRSRY